jgi:glycosyltransferase involved in cell wall biosynthesis
MRVMYLSATGQLGGAEVSLLDILASIRDAQPSWPLHLLLAADGPLADRAASLGVSTATLPFPPSVARLGESGAIAAGRRSRFAAQLALAASPIAAYISRLRRRVHRVDPDVLHTNGLKMHVLAAQARLSPKLVWHLHDYLGRRGTSARLLQWSRSQCAIVIANSASVADDVRRTLKDMDVTVVLNAVDLNRFSPSGDQLNLDELAGLSPAPEGAVRIGLLGTFARWKGHTLFLNAVASMATRTPIRAYIIGDAVYETDGSQYTRDELRRVAERLGIGHSVGFTGHVARPEAALRALDIVAHASTEPEPFGLVIIEAMASERPVVVSLAGGAAEIVTAGVDALGYAPGDVEALAARLTELATDPALRLRIARAGRATAEKRFDRSRLASQLVPIYQSVVDCPRPTADIASVDD